VVEDAEGVGLGMPLYSSPPADATVGRATTPSEYMEAFREIVVVVCCLFRAVTLQPAAVPAGQSTVKVLFVLVRVGSTASHRIASHRIALREKRYAQRAEDGAERDSLGIPILNRLRDLNMKGLLALDQRNRRREGA
jgi:hypothetical protein